jgi:hypothetical protein
MSQSVKEEVKSEYGYPPGYKPKRITEQVDILRQLLGISSIDEKIVKQLLPAHAEEWFAIPRWQGISNVYGEAVREVLKLIGRQRDFSNKHEGPLGEAYLRQHKRTAEKLRTLSKQQGNSDILIVPAQFGLFHRGRSVRRVREIFGVNEFGLGAFEIACMLLTHPERFSHYDDLWIDCAGDEYDPGAGSDFSHAFFFNFNDNGRVNFGTGYINKPHVNYGSVSAFLPC